MCHVDLAAELDTITNASPPGEESRGGNNNQSMIFRVTLEYFQQIFFEWLWIYIFSCIVLSGERLIQYASEYLVTEVLIAPQLNTLQQCMKNMLGSFTKHRHILHGGYTFAGTGAWVLQVIFQCIIIFTQHIESEIC